MRDKKIYLEKSMIMDFFLNRLKNKDISLINVMGNGIILKVGNRNFKRI